MSYAADKEDEERVGASCGIDALKSEEEDYEHDEEESNECADETHDRKLFTQPDSSYGECPLCFLPLQLDPSKSSFFTCCSSLICRGCLFAQHVSNMNDDRCPFCREPAIVEEMDKRMMKRVKANDPAAMSEMGRKLRAEGDMDGAIEYWMKAAELGDLMAHWQLGLMYQLGPHGVERDEEKSIYHYEMAAIGGHPLARFTLALNEEDNGNMERAVKHYIIAANLGCDESMKALWKHYSDGNITKENLDATLRTHQAAIDAMKSAQRDAADVVFKNYDQ